MKKPTYANGRECSEIIKKNSYTKKATTDSLKLSNSPDQNHYHYFTCCLISMFVHTILKG